jgi:hypothetical protein
MMGRGRLASTLALAAGLAIGFAVANAEEKFAKLDGVLGTLDYRPDALQRWYRSDPAGVKGGERSEEVYAVRFEAVAEGVAEHIKIGIADMRIDLDRHGRLLGYEQLLTDPGLVKRAKIDRRIVKAADGKLASNSYLDGKQKSTKSGAFGYDYLDIQSAGETLQALLQSGRAMSFKAKLHIGDGASYAVKYEYLRTADPRSLSGKFDYPERFKAALPAGGKYSVFVMSAEPPMSIAYPHRLYYAYDETRDFAFCAFWGGKPEEAQYQARLFSEEGR